jgi:hypothetical protein
MQCRHTYLDGLLPMVICKDTECHHISISQLDNPSAYNKRSIYSRSKGHGSSSDDASSDQWRDMATTQRKAGRQAAGVSPYLEQ